MENDCDIHFLGQTSTTSIKSVQWLYVKVISPINNRNFLFMSAWQSKGKYVELSFNQ